MRTRLPFCMVFSLVLILGGCVAVTAARRPVGSAVTPPFNANLAEPDAPHVEAQAAAPDAPDAVIVGTQELESVTVASHPGTPPAAALARSTPAGFQPASEDAHAPIPAPTAFPHSQERNSDQRLMQLWEERTQQTMADYPIGPGDVIEINVPAMPELKDRTVRVSGDRNLSLPLVGNVDTSGMTERDLKDELHRRLERYMYNPQLDLFVKEYRSRQVAVMGAVEKPGLYNLASGADTLMSMLSQAGGLSKEAAERVLFIPAEDEKNSRSATNWTGISGANAAGSESLPVVYRAEASKRDTRMPGANIKSLFDASNPVVIDLRNLARGGTQRYLSMPARPGDVIVVPIAGQVMVQGWVNKPGSYQITPGLTLLGSIAAAGGPLFAADQRSVQIARTASDGQKIFLRANLNKIKLKEEPDIPVQEGDVVDVGYSRAKIIPYVFYSMMQRVGIGASAPLY